MWLRPLLSEAGSSLPGGPALSPPGSTFLTVTTGGRVPVFPDRGGDPAHTSARPPGGERAG
ncbi:hypothetical protein APASM_6884 [Actinosynnema pretiosum subsp. pretiosum]|nr:hypothetical protein APASM_6884 [Actinosynnema pretiosum subsp. pretiosum]